ncbi:hypothetical protein M8J76_012176 [Diaphorina citri]|nr:hypothetical protein M8J75_007207 [Diaphorina citri]KAI5730300.1 hypothetical protein M8J76_012176 [Diaphorina citri]
MLKDRDDSSSPCPEEKSSCGGCGQPIIDRFYLLAVDRQWHLGCLQCAHCHVPLHSELSCFSRHGNIYCKQDYFRLFGVKRCGRCQMGISSSELVMRARDLVFHLHCFTCISCGILLTKGDLFGMRDEMIYCRPHYEILRHRDYCGSAEIEQPMSPRPAPWQPTTVQKGRPRKRKLSVDSPTPPSEDINANVMRIPSTTLEMLHSGDLSSSMESLSYESGAGNSSPGSGVHSHQRTKRMRTSFKHHQLRTMKSYFNINQNPDAKDLKQLAQKTGLSKRVLQVWFQNARAKWRRNVMRSDSGAQMSVQSVIGGPPSVGPNSILIGSEDEHSLHHPQQTPPHSQLGGYGDMYN